MAGNAQEETLTKLTTAMKFVEMGSTTAITSVMMETRLAGTAVINTAKSSWAIYATEEPILLLIHVLRSVEMVWISSTTHVMTETWLQEMDAMQHATLRMGGTVSSEQETGEMFAGTGITTLPSLTLLTVLRTTK